MRRRKPDARARMRQRIDKEHADDDGGNDELLHRRALLVGVGIVRKIVSRFPKRISQFLNFDEKIELQRIVTYVSRLLRGMSTTYPMSSPTLNGTVCGAIYRDAHAASMSRLALDSAKQAPPDRSLEGSLPHPLVYAAQSHPGDQRAGDEQQAGASVDGVCGTKGRPCDGNVQAA